MSLAGYQRALAELIMAPSLRAEVAALSPPELPEALASLELTERERRRLHAVARDRGMVMVTMLHRSTRLSMLSNTLPRTCAALGAETLREVVHGFWKEHLPTSVMYLREGLRFGAFLRERLRSGALVHELLPDLLEAELALLELGKGGWVAPPTREDPPEGPALEEAWVELSPWCRVLRFQREPRAVLRALGHPDVPLPEGEAWLVFEGVAPGRVSLHGVDAARGRLLLAGRQAARDCEAGLLQELLRRGFLRLVREK